MSHVTPSMVLHGNNVYEDHVRDHELFDGDDDDDDDDGTHLPPAALDGDGDGDDDDDDGGYDYAPAA